MRRLQDGNDLVYFICLFLLLQEGHRNETGSPREGVVLGEGGAGARPFAPYRETKLKTKQGERLNDGRSLKQRSDNNASWKEHPSRLLRQHHQISVTR